MRISDWSSDVCSSDLNRDGGGGLGFQSSLQRRRLVPIRAIGGTDIPESSLSRAGLRIPDEGRREAVSRHARWRQSLLSRGQDRKSTRLNSSHYCAHRMPPSACKKQIN